MTLGGFGQEAVNTLVRNSGCQALNTCDRDLCAVQFFNMDLSVVTPVSVLVASFRGKAFSSSSVPSQVAAMTDEAYKSVVIILAGYTNEIHDMLGSNPGAQLGFREGSVLCWLLLSSPFCRLGHVHSACMSTASFCSTPQVSF